MDDIVDWHAHWVPPEVIDLLGRREREPLVVREGGGRSFVHGPGERLPLKEGQLDIEARLAEMDRAGVRRQVLSLAVVLGRFMASLPDFLERPLVEATNAGLSRLVAERGERFSGLASLPMRDPDSASAILEKAVAEQGLLGAILPADAFADKATALRFAGVFATADRLGAHLFVHPGPLPGGAVRPSVADEADLIRRRAVAFQDSLTSAAVTFEFTDFLDAYPNAVVHLANLGGTIAFLAERIAMTAERMELPSSLADGRLRRIFVDTASFGTRGVRLAAEVLGADRLVFGTDSPALRIAPGLDGVRGACVGGSERAILRGAGVSSSLTKIRRADMS